MPVTAAMAPNKTRLAQLSKRGLAAKFVRWLTTANTFGLASILDNSTPSIQLDGNETKVYAASEIPGIDVKALAYFSASIFWRGSLNGWNDDGSVPVPLGPYACQVPAVYTPF